MVSERSSRKRRLHIVLSMDNPLQREALLILSHAKNKTSTVCEAVCGYHKLKNLEDTLRSVLQDELKHITAVPVPQAVEIDKESKEVVDDAVLGFLWSLQNDE